jgi:hypothetical protein
MTAMESALPDVVVSYRNLSSTVMLSRKAAGRTMTTVPRVILNGVTAIPRALYGLGLRIAGRPQADEREEFKILDNVSGCSECPKALRARQMHRLFA